MAAMTVGHPTRSVTTRRTGLARGRWSGAWFGLDGSADPLEEGNHKRGGDVLGLGPAAM
jgi:hypothetical protein